MNAAAELRPAHASDRAALALLLIGSLFSYAYFYQGDGWSMTSHFVTIRSLIERGTFEITPYLDQTGDITVARGRAFSNKPPGLVLAGAVPYLAIYWIERTAGWDPGWPRVAGINQYLLTVLLCAVPGAGLAGMLYHWFRTRSALSIRTSLALATAFALGSLVWPYSGMLFNHVLVAALLFGAWMLLTSETQSMARALIAGTLLGVALLTDYIVLPMLPLLAIYDLLRRRSVARTAMLCGGPLLALAGLMLYQAVNFGNPLTTSYANDNPVPGLLLGKFHWPQWKRLYWLTYHRYRGLLVNCPVFVVPLLSLLTLRREDWRPRLETIVPLAIAGYLIVFQLTYVSWAGGWGVGPRFFIPAMPLLFVFAVRAWQRYPRVSMILAGLSIVNMLSVTSVRALYPGSDRGAPTHEDPLGVCLLGMCRGLLAQGPGSFNLGTLIGLRGAWSLLPLVVGWAAIVLIGRQYLRK